MKYLVNKTVLIRSYLPVLVWLSSFSKRRFDFRVPDVPTDLLTDDGVLSSFFARLGVSSSSEERM